MHKRKEVVKLAAKSPMLSMHARNFFEKAGGSEHKFFVDDAHLFEFLEKHGLASNEVIKGLAANRNLELQKIGPMIGENRNTFMHWVSGLAIKPPHEKLLKLLGPQGFNLDQYPPGTARLYKELVCRSADCFLDRDHVLQQLRDGKINYHGKDGALAALIALEAETLSNYAFSIGYADYGNISRWIKGELGTPRKALLDLLEGATDAHKRMALNKAGHFYDVQHLIATFRNTNRLTELLAGIRNIYHLENGDMGMSTYTIIAYQNNEKSPTPASLATIFATVRKDHPEMEALWDSYKDVAARFFGNISEPRYSGYAKKLDNARLAIDTGFRGSGYSLG